MDLWGSFPFKPLHMACVTDVMDGERVLQHIVPKLLLDIVG